MQISEQWLRQWIDPKVSTEKLCEQFTALGLEVESATNIQPKLDKVIVAEVIECEKHPEADRLSCCKVKIGKNEILDIVCGAKNVRKGLKVALVQVGGSLLGGPTIQAAKLRGATSQGMICSVKELGLAAESEGILELPADAPVGQDIVDYLQLKDHVIDLSITPNRGDCLSIQGLARDLAALNHLKITAPAIKKAAVKTKTQLKVEVKNAVACPRYCGRVLENINSKAQIPLWMSERLRRSNLRLIHPVVDVLNYVMLELGQPMHAFDLSKISKKITVRNAKDAEKITLLDQKEISLNKENLVIADDEAVLALAGMMGGLDSGVSAETKSIFIESAYFAAGSIVKTARQFGISSDSAYRFERGVDFDLPQMALERATQLLLEIVGGEAGPITEVTDKTKLPKRTTIALSMQEVPRLLGIDIPVAKAKAIFTVLNFKLKAAKNSFDLTPPSYRYDITQSHDCIEELARIHGFDKIPMTPLIGELRLSTIPETYISAAKIAKTLIDRGYSEAITYSFVEDNLQQKINPTAKVWELINPLSQELAVMRTSLWPGLLTTAQFNLNRSAARVRLFEIGHTFLNHNDKVIEKSYLSGIACGEAFPTSWAAKARPLDFYDVKGDLEALLQLTGKRVEFKPTEQGALHPGQSAAIYVDGKPIGYLGALHPALAQELDLATTPYLFELEMAALEEALLPSYCEISKFPAISRDLAIVVNEAVQASDIKDKISAEGGKLLNKVEIFDIYQGAGIAAGHKSVALGLSFEDPTRTLLDDEVNAVLERIVHGLEQAFNAKLRE